MNVRTVAERLEISESLVYALLASGKLKGTRHGLGRGTWRVSEQAILDYIRSTEWEGDADAAPREGLKHLHL